MGKFVGLVGAMTTVGAMAYLMAPLPQSATSASDLPAPATVTRGSSPAEKIVVTSSPKPSAETPIRIASAPSSPRAEPATTLVQQIQTELYRLGCYNGAIDGQWSDMTQRAMQALGERVSVLRPVDTPDYIMLALARSQTGTVCGSTQRSVEADLRDRRAAAPPPTDVPSKGAVRPTSAAARVAAPEPDRPSAAQGPRVWRAVPDASQKRTVARAVDPGVEAARLKAAREEPSKRATAAANPLPATPAADDAASSGQLPDGNRMGLGVGPGDPLLAHIDPRNPNAPAILRAPPQPLPRVALQAGEQPAQDNRGAPAPIAQAPPPAAVAPSPPTPAHVARREAKRDWRRNVFTDMRFNGP